MGYLIPEGENNTNDRPESTVKTSLNQFSFTQQGSSLSFAHLTSIGRTIYRESKLLEVSSKCRLKDITGGNSIITLDVPGTGERRIDGVISRVIRRIRVEVPPSPAPLITFHEKFERIRFGRLPPIMLNFPRPVTR